MIKNIIGRPVSTIGVFVGYILLVGSVILVFLNGFFPSGLLLIISLLIVSVVQGIQVDPINNKLRSYISFFGIKKGKWEELEKFPFLSILRKNKRQDFFPPNMMVGGTSLKSVQFEICLLTNNHIDRMLLKTVDQKEDALRIAEEYSRLLKKPIVEYNPKRISKRRR